MALFFCHKIFLMKFICIDFNSFSLVLNLLRNDMDAISKILWSIFIFTPMDIFYICLSYALFVFMIFFRIFTKTSLSAPMEYEFVKKHKLLTIGLVILGLFLVLFLYGILSYFHIPVIS